MSPEGRTRQVNAQIAEGMDKWATSDPRAAHALAGHGAAVRTVLPLGHVDTISSEAIWLAFAGAGGRMTHQDEAAATDRLRRALLGVPNRAEPSPGRRPAAQGAAASGGGCVLERAGPPGRSQHAGHRDGGGGGLQAVLRGRFGRRRGRPAPRHPGAAASRGGIGVTRRKPRPEERRRRANPAVCGQGNSRERFGAPRAASNLSFGHHRRWGHVSGGCRRAACGLTPCFGCVQRGAEMRAI